MMYTVLNNEGRPSRSNSQRETQDPNPANFKTIIMPIKNNTYTV
jgi:hypothetical protein